MRSQETYPEDPHSYMMDYFGNERSSQWDEMDDLQEENAIIETELPGMHEEIEKLTKQLELAQRKTKVMTCFKNGIEGD